MELYKAHEQWKTRADDERFSSLQALYDATKAYAANAKEASVSYGTLRVEAVKNDVQLVGRAGVPAKFTHWAFSQLCARIETPADYMRKLPATLACQNINYGLANRSSLEDAKLLLHVNGGYVLRALTTEKYARIWNWEVAERLLSLPGEWEPARPDYDKADQTPPALYASDHDMFAFLRSKDRTIKEIGTDEPIWRGWIVENSEVGAAALKLTRFLYRYMCGNHIIWGASKVMDMSIRHVGEAKEKWARFAIEMRKYDESSARDDEARIAETKRTVIAATKEEVLDAVFGKRHLGLSRKTIEAGYNATVEDKDGSPRTQWGLVQGLTRYSQSIAYADKRTDIDRAAGKLMEVKF